MSSRIALELTDANARKLLRLLERNPLPWRVAVAVDLRCALALCHCADSPTSGKEGTKGP